ncbi:MAG: TVP38/TMEM64 family protein [Cyanobacteria bacterium P01_A01_bin.84]
MDSKLIVLNNQYQNQKNRQNQPQNYSNLINIWQLRFLRLLILVILGFTFTLWIHSEPALAQEVINTGGFNPQKWLQNALTWINQQGAVGGVAFMLLYIVATVAFLPGSILTLGAGVIFGVALGSLYVFIGASIGAIAAFLVGRYLARSWVEKKIAGNEKFAAVDRAVGREGLKIVLLTRLSPVFPFNLLNYAYGVTGVSLKDYILGTIGILPGTIMYVYIGSLAGNLATIGTGNQPGNPTIEWTIRIVGFIATVAVTLYVTKIAKKALNEEVSGKM